VEVGDLDLRGLQRVELIGGEKVAFPVIVAREVGPQDLEAVADRDAGGDDEERIGEPLVLGLASLLSVCQAMSIAMTTVLPDPVAILKAIR
jgi:hypothetical protein